MNVEEIKTWIRDYKSFFFIWLFSQVLVAAYGLLSS